MPLTTRTKLLVAAGVLLWMLLIAAYLWFLDSINLDIDAPYD